jgi:hypothetical protein
MDTVPGEEGIRTEMELPATVSAVPPVTDQVTRLSIAFVTFAERFTTLFTCAEFVLGVRETETGGSTCSVAVAVKDGSRSEVARTVTVPMAVPITDTDPELLVTMVPGPEMLHCTPPSKPTTLKVTVREVFLEVEAGEIDRREVFPPPPDPPPPPQA